VLKEHAPHAKDFTQKKGYKNRALSDSEKEANCHKSKTRSRVEHIFGIMKHQFGNNKVRYRGLAKKAYNLYVKCALINLVIAKRTLLTA
jgi:transposase, IS5 family